MKTSLILCAALLLGACAGLREVQSTVRSHSSLEALPQPATYRLELLPSQQELRNQARFAAIEAQAHRALTRAGLRRDDGDARLVVQIAARVQRLRDWPPSPFWSHARFGWWWGHPGWWDWPAPHHAHTEHERAVHIVMREAQGTQGIVFETSAERRDAWGDDPLLFGALFDAALDGFPSPPAGERRVRTTLEPS